MSKWLLLAAWLVVIAPQIDSTEVDPQSPEEEGVAYEYTEEDTDNWADSVCAPLLQAHGIDPLLLFNGPALAKRDLQALLIDKTGEEDIADDDPFFEDVIRDLYEEMKQLCDEKHNQPHHKVLVEQTNQLSTAWKKATDLPKCPRSVDEEIQAFVWKKKPLENLQALTMCQPTQTSKSMVDILLEYLDPWACHTLLKQLDTTVDKFLQRCHDIWRGQYDDEFPVNDEL